MDKSRTWTRVDPKFCADKWRYFLNWRHNEMCARNGWRNLHLNYVSIYNFVKKLIYIINLKYITMTKKFKLKTAKKKGFFFLKRSYKIIPFNNNNAICQRNIMEQPSNMNFQFPGCSVFWEVLNIDWIKLRVYLLFLMATLYVYTIICIHSKF